MNRKNILKNLLLSSLALSFAASCTPIPYPPQQNAVGILGGPRQNTNTGTNIGQNTAPTITPNSGSSAYRESQQSSPNSGYRNNDPNRYTPQVQKPTYRPPAPTIPTTPTPSRTSNGSYPTATPSIKANTVISPYPPYNVLDTTGASSGDKLCDPSTIPIDPATGKPYINPDTGLPDVKRGKYFIVP